MKRGGFAVAAVTALVAGAGTPVLSGLSAPATAVGQAPSAAAVDALADPAPTPEKKAEAVRAARRNLVAHRARVRATTADAFTVRSILLDRGGASHVRFDRTYRGLPVYGGDVVVHNAPDQKFRAADTAMAQPPAVSVKSAVTAAAAAATAAQTFPGTRAKTGVPRLVVDATGDSGRSQRLAWETVVEGIRADQTPSRLHVLVDARSGAVIRSFDDVHTGTGNSIYGGRVTVSTSRSGSTYRLVDPVRGNGQTTDLRNRTSGSGTVFTDADDTWGDGTVQDTASAAVDAHYGAMTTYDFYRNVLRRNGIWNDGRGARSRVHYGSNYANAFWDGQQMTYGDGRGNSNPLVSLDVAGHEMTHGVTQNTAGLNYSGDAGGLNEATSDILGTMVEFFAANSADPGDYDIGEKINIRGDGRPLRYMYDPAKDGRSDSCWTTSTPGKNPHQASGVGNHFFFLLAEGSNSAVFPKSPTCDGSAVSGIGRDNAAQIWYRALSVYMTSSESYRQARQDTLRAAADLYGRCGAEYKAVRAAWSAVSVTGTDSCPG